MLKLCTSYLGCLLISIVTLLPYEQPGLKAIIVGASSGLGRGIAKELAKHGYTLGLAGRRLALLESLAQEIQTPSHIQYIDVINPQEARAALFELISKLGGLDLIVLSVSSYANIKDFTKWEELQTTLDVDARGFIALADAAIDYFTKQNHGHLVGISSIDGLRGHAMVPVYSGANACISVYMEGIRNRMAQNNIPVYVTDILPGWVDVEHTTYSARPDTWWVASTQEAAYEIYEAIVNKKKRAYITKRWQIIAWILALLPDWIYNRIGGI